VTLLTSIALLVAVAAATYVFCVRPMHRGGRPISQAMWRTLGTRLAGGAVTGLDARLASAREEVARLRERAQLPVPAANTPKSSVDGRDVSWVCTAFAEPLTLQRNAPPTFDAAPDTYSAGGLNQQKTSEAKPGTPRAR
jgi:hypothetical protein